MRVLLLAILLTACNKSDTAQDAIVVSPLGCWELHGVRVDTTSAARLCWTTRGHGMTVAGSYAVYEVGGRTDTVEHEEQRWRDAYRQLGLTQGDCVVHTD